MEATFQILKGKKRKSKESFFLLVAYTREHRLHTVGVEFIICVLSLRVMGSCCAKRNHFSNLKKRRKKKKKKKKKDRKQNREKKKKIKIKDKNLKKQ